MSSDKQSFFMVSSIGSSIVSPVASNPGKSVHSAIISSRFIISALEQRSTATLIRAAEIAYTHRDVQAIEAAARALLQLGTSEAINAGLFYLGVATKRQGRIAESITLLEQATDGPSARFRARAIQALGVIEHERNKPGAASNSYLQAAQIAGEADLLTLFSANCQISAITSEQGDHGKALDQLAELWPLVRLIAPTHPQVYYHFRNDTAFELGQLGRIEEAQKHIAIVRESQLFSAYPEWQENNRDIEKKKQEADCKPCVIVIHRPEPKPQPKRPRTIYVAELAIWFDRSSNEVNACGSMYLARVRANTLQLERIKYSITRRGPPQFHTP